MNTLTISQTLTGSSKKDLPRVLIIGDSISMGYTDTVKQRLDGKACVARIPENGESTHRGLEMLDIWVGEDVWDVIHFNWGLHDLKYFKDGSLDLAGTQISSLEVYEKNLEQLVVRLKPAAKRLIWATTTPVPDKSAGRIQGSEIAYNAAALAIMQNYDVLVNDLYSQVLSLLSKYQQPHNVHFNSEGYEFLGRLVAESIEKVIE